MKLVSYLLSDGVHYGAVKGARIVDLKSRMPYADIVAFIACGGESQARPILEAEPGDYDYERVTLLPVVPNPGKIICVGVNYEEHRIEAGREKTEHPMIFSRWPESLTGHRAPILRAPRVSTQLDYEAELLVVMGTRAPRYTARKDALRHVFGYACFNEACHRDWQFHTRQLVPGKNFESTGASGPWIVTADEIPDPQNLKLQMRLNGEVMQDAHTRDMTFPVDALIEYITCWLPLNPGDLIVSGTPGGVGFKRSPPVFMKPGDIAEVEIEKIGVLVNPVADE